MSGDSHGNLKLEASVGLNQEGGGVVMPVTLGAAAYRRTAHLSEAITEEQLQRVNTDLNATSVTALGALPKLRAARADLVRKLPAHDMTYFDAFEDIAWALTYVESQVNATEEENRALTAQADTIKAEVSDLKDFLVAHANYGQLNMVPLRKIGTEFGYKALLNDAGTVIELLAQNWEKLGSKAPFSAERLQEFDREVAAFRTAIGLKQQNPEGPREELIRRRRVFTLFRLAVANIREALIYTYGESKVGEYVPGFSNATGKASSRSPKDEDAELEPEAESEGETSAEHPSSPLRASGFKINNPQNLPISSPFVDEDDKQESA